MTKVVNQFGKIELSPLTLKITVERSEVVRDEWGRLTGYNVDYCNELMPECITSFIDSKTVYAWFMKHQGVSPFSYRYDVGLGDFEDVLTDLVNHIQKRRIGIFYDLPELSDYNS